MPRWDKSYLAGRERCVIDGCGCPATRQWNGQWVCVLHYGALKNYSGKVGMTIPDWYWKAYE